MVLLIGTFCSFLAHELKINNIIFLLAAGMVLGGLHYLDFSSELITTFSILLLILIVFNSTVKFKFKEVLRFSLPVAKLSLVFFLINVIIMTAAAKYILGIPIIVAALFSTLMYGIDPAISGAVLGRSKKKVLQILHLESLFNSPLTVIVSFSILGIIAAGVSVSSQVLPFVQQIIAGVGVGVVIALLVIAVLRREYVESYSHIALITAAIVCYILAELLKGNGVLAVTVFGLLFGNFKVKEKLKLEEFTLIFTDSLEIFVFILIGSTLVLNLDAMFYVKGIILFIIYLFARYLSVVIATKRLSAKQRLFMTLNVPKGIDVAVMLSIIIVVEYHITGIPLIVEMAVFFMLISIVLAVITSKFARRLVA